MKQAMYGLALYIFLILPPVATLMESVMAIHMHMQMPLLVIAGMLMAKFFQIKFPAFFEKWNSNGVPGLLLFIIIWTYWMLPRTMDEALTLQSIEIFKFISLPFLAGISLRDSWRKLDNRGKYSIYIYLILSSIVMGWLYIASPEQLCNNYLIVEQRALGWSFVIVGACVLAYFIQLLFYDPSEYE
ncbi:hypothetical protein QGM71_09165 [Virgibacillus sp. C22-A2]|uniref:Transmembrane protein n=1 Tax=Virgibacillus tibetensis TaxID=3042313 RepID=A0ABU6KFJ3_9BACI|nr:hypothetical protein [Virgibacillus sp. C22-A2]